MCLIKLKKIIDWKYKDPFFLIKILILNREKTNLILILIDSNKLNLKDFILILRTGTGTIKENWYRK